MAYVNHLKVARTLLEAVGEALDQTLYAMEDQESLSQAPDAFVAYDVRPAAVRSGEQYGLAAKDLGALIIPVDFFVFRPREAGVASREAAAETLTAIAAVAAEYLTWRGEHAVVMCDVSGFSVGGGPVEEGLEDGGQATVTAGSLTVEMVVLC